MKVEFLIPSELVLNSNQRLHPHVKAKKTKALRTLAESEAQGLRGLQPCRVIAWLAFPDRRRRDPNNWWPTVKALMDGLVDAGVWEDDNSQIIQGPDHRILDYTIGRGHVYVCLEVTSVEERLAALE
jgi:crossover junction endodeoxyribonuclease RusA